MDVSRFGSIENLFLGGIQVSVKDVVEENINSLTVGEGKGGKKTRKSEKRSAMTRGKKKEEEERRRKKREEEGRRGNKRKEEGRRRAKV